MTISQRVALTVLQMFLNGGEATIRVPAVMTVTADEFVELVRFVLSASIGDGQLEAEDVTAQLREQQPELPLG